jgi:hypothetical protein
MAVSSRGVGSVKGNIVENYKLVNWDLIPNLEQSDHQAEMYGIVEGVLETKNFLITESDEIQEITKPDEIKEPIVEAKKELTLDEKKKLAEEFVNKFSKVLDKVSVNEAMKVNSKMAAIQVIQMSIQKIQDEKVKDMLQSAVDFLAKEFGIELK